MADKIVLLHDAEGNALYPKIKAENLTEALPIDKGGTGVDNITDLFKIVEARYPTSGIAVFRHAQNVGLTATIPDGYGLLFIGQLLTNGFVGSGYVLTPPQLQEGTVGLGSWMSLRDGNFTGYVTAQCLCIKLR